MTKSKANSHKGQGWEKFTDSGRFSKFSQIFLKKFFNIFQKSLEAIKAVSQNCKNVVFLLWGGPAGKKATLIDKKKHLILQAPHPSPLSSHRGYFGCQHFSKGNILYFTIVTFIRTGL